MKHLFALLSLAAALSPAAHGQLIVQTGDDLQAIVDAAPSGAVIEIQSSSFYDVALDFSGTNAKDLILRAGAGHKPTLWNATLPPITVGQDDMKLHFEGLTIDNGLPAFGVDCFKVTGNGALGQLAEVTFVDCTLDDRAYVYGVGDASVDLAFQGCTILGELEIRGVDYTLDLEVKDSVVGSIHSHPTSDITLDAVVHDTEVLGSIELDESGSTGTWEFRRCFLRGPVECRAPDTTAAIYTLFESCLIGDPDGSVAGLGFTNRKSDGSEPRLVSLAHCTVTGFDEGVDVSASVIGSLIYGNAVDATPATDPSAFSWSMIEDGSIALTGLNLTGPVFTNQFGALKYWNPGVDLGSTAAPLLGATDVYGEPRLQDSDFDGVARANIGAVERVAGADASAKPFNGTGINLPVMSSTLPILGSLIHITIAGGPSTLLSLLAIDAPAPAPFPIPGWQGEVLLAATPGLFLQVASGDHYLPINLDPTLVGVAVSAQGARVDVVGGGPKVRLCNRTDYVLGI